MTLTRQQAEILFNTRIVEANLLGATITGRQLSSEIIPQHRITRRIPSQEPVRDDPENRIALRRVTVEDDNLLGADLSAIERRITAATLAEEAGGIVYNQVRGEMFGIGMAAPKLNKYGEPIEEKKKESKTGKRWLDI